jgi:hypothetical protein
MDFTKYVSLLVKSALWCSSLRALEVDDPFEGAAGLLKDQDANNAAFEQQMFQLHLDGLKSDDEYTQRRYARGRDSSLTDEEYAKQIVKEELKFQEETRAKNRETTYVSCWYESNFESLAMWKLYSKDNQNAVAIKTTCGSLRRATGNLPHPLLKIGRVNYIDYAAPPDNFNTFSDWFPSGADKEWFKSFHFAHEREVRVIPVPLYAGEGSAPLGEPLNVDLSILIEGIYVSPWSQPWLRDIVMEISNKYGVYAPVTESEIARKPYY